MNSTAIWRACQGPYRAQLARQIPWFPLRTAALLHRRFTSPDVKDAQDGEVAVPVMLSATQEDAEAR
jgi:hypothetical protein